MTSDKLRIIPIGGVGEIGKNMMLLEYRDDIIIIDAGLKFPEEEMLGIDLVIPDITYLRENKHKIRGLLLTHGHEDHIGAVPYILPEINIPIYATSLTRGLLGVKLKESALTESTKIVTVEPGESVQLGCFKVEFFSVNHSIPDCVGLAIETPLGVVVHTGDFKFDHTPVHGPPTDMAKLAELGNRGVLAILSDCIRVENPGYTPSERVVGQTFDNIFYRTVGRTIIATFASNISRIQQIIEVAYDHGRKVAVAGRSMENNVRVAADLGFLWIPEDTMVPIEQARKLPQDRMVFISTGSQGEPTSVLSRIASNEHRHLKITPGDMVIISATPIPGNQTTVSRTIDNLCRLGADVIYEPMMQVHVSGHASQEELKLMLNLVRPKYCMPIHCGYRHMVLYRNLAADLGIPPSNVICTDNGQVVEFGADGARLAERVPAGLVLVDGLTVGEVGQVVLRDRQLLARDGVVVVVLALDRETGRVVAGPDITTKGFVYTPEADGLLESARQVVVEMLNRSSTAEVEYSFITHKVKQAIGEYLYRQTGLRPLILPVITEI